MSTKCNQHKYNECEFAYLKQNAKNILLCSDCVDESQGAIKMSDCVAIKLALLSDNTTILSKFPPLGNPTLTQLIAHLCSSIDSEKKKIKEFYQKLVDNYEKAIKRAMIKSKTEINQLEQLQQGFILQYQKVAQTQQLKELLLQQQKSNEGNKLRIFLEDKIKQSASNSNFIEAQIKQLQQYRDNFSTQQAEMIATKIEEDINSISFFCHQEQISLSVPLVINQSNLTNKKSILQKICLVPSKVYQKSAKDFKISTTDKKQIQILFPESLGQCYFENKLNPNKRYIITLKNTLGDISQPPFFSFGMIRHSARHYFEISEEGLFYDESYCNFDYGITKILKGEKLHFERDYETNMENNWREYDNRRFEIRICIKDKLLRVGLLPNYELVAEISNEDDLDLSKEYIFAFRAAQNETILIEDVCEVESFDDLM